MYLPCLPSKEAGKSSASWSSDGILCDLGPRGSNGRTARLWLRLSLYSMRRLGPATTGMSILERHLVLGTLAGLIAVIWERWEQKVGTGWSISLCLCGLSLQLDQLLWDSSPSGFMQWRPVAFSQKQRSRESALPCQASSLNYTLAHLLPRSPVVQAFFGSQKNFCAFTLTFGAPTGPGYWDQHYLSW